MIMSGQTMNYKKYYDYLKTMPEPIMPSQLPKIKINFSTISKFAKEHNICFANLSESEKADFINNICK
jgi:hypothetical protein